MMLILRRRILESPRVVAAHQRCAEAEAIVGVLERVAGGRPAVPWSPSLPSRARARSA